jgi:hypothetical protein
MLEFEHAGWCISVVSHDPSPSQMQVTNFCSKHGGEWASSWRNLSSSFVDSKQKAPETLRENYCEHCCAPSTYKTPLAARPCVPPVHWAGYCPATIRCPNRATIKNHSARRSSSRRSRIPQ